MNEQSNWIPIKAAAGLTEKEEKEQLNWKTNFQIFIWIKFKRFGRFSRESSYLRELPKFDSLAAPFRSLPF